MIYSDISINLFFYLQSGPTITFFLIIYLNFIYNETLQNLGVSIELFGISIGQNCNKELLIETKLLSKHYLMNFK